MLPMTEKNQRILGTAAVTRDLWLHRQQPNTRPSLRRGMTRLRGPCSAALFFPLWINKKYINIIKYPNCREEQEQREKSRPKTAPAPVQEKKIPMDPMRALACLEFVSARGLETSDTGPKILANHVLAQQSISSMYLRIKLFSVWDEDDKTWEETCRATGRHGEEEKSKTTAGWHTRRVFQGVDMNACCFDLTFYLSARFGMTTVRLTRRTNFSGRRMLRSTLATFLLQHTWVKRRWRGRNRKILHYTR